MPARSRKRPIFQLLQNRRNQVLIGSLLTALVLFGLVIPMTAMQFENHDGFCASCHTEGEQTFFNRSVSTAAADLASLHDLKGQARCIDCHTGPGVIGRFGGLMAGATDLISYFSGHYPQPAGLEGPYPDGNCLKCHAKVLAGQDMNNHFHVFLSQWQALDKNAATCVSCHSAHDPSGDTTIAFLNKATTLAVCQKCHASAGGG